MNHEEGEQGVVGLSDPDMGVNGDEMQTVIEIESEEALVARLDRESFQIEIEDLNKVNAAYAREIDRYHELLAQRNDTLRAARRLLQQICDHESTMADTEIMLKLVMDFIWRPKPNYLDFAPPLDDIGDIPF